MTWHRNDGGFFEGRGNSSSAQESVTDVCEDIFELFCAVFQHAIRNVVRPGSLASVDPQECAPHAGWGQTHGLVTTRGLCLLCRCGVLCLRACKEVLEVVQQRDVTGL